MKKNAQATRFGTVAMIALVAAALVAVMAAPAFADEPLVIDHMYFNAEELQIQPVEDQPMTEDAGDWEMVPQPVFPDAGSDEVVGPDEFEEPIPDGGEDEVVVPEDEQSPDDTAEPETPDAETPEQSVPETPTAEPSTPGEPSLPFTGGNATPYAVAGLLMALAGVGVLIARRRAFNR